MSRQFNRRALIAGSAAVAGGFLASQVRDVGTLTSRFRTDRLQSIAREPLHIAMLDRHAQRIQPLTATIEQIVNRRLQIDALPAEQLYANYTIDLLQQTGRYDVVSINDHWIPYFGRRGYLSEVGSLAEADSAVTYPPLVESAAQGIDGSRLVAYPWSLDFTCTAVHRDRAELVDGVSWLELIGALERDGGFALGLGLQAPRSAADAYRSVLLSSGQELLREDDGEPILDHYWPERCLDLLVRLSRLAAAHDPLSTSLENVAVLAEQGAINLAPVLWASDSRALVDSQTWTLLPSPHGRPGRRRTCVTVWMLGIPAGAPSQGKAREFVEAVTSAELQSQLWQRASLLPATRSAIQSGEAAWELVRPLAFDALDRGRLRPALRSYRGITDIIGQLVVEAVSTDTPISQLVEAANRKIRDVLLLEDELKGLS